MSNNQDFTKAMWRKEMLEEEREQMVNMKIVYLPTVFFHVLFVILFFLQRLDDQSQEKEKRYPLL